MQAHVPERGRKGCAQRVRTTQTFRVLSPQPQWILSQPMASHMLLLRREVR
jgi:hypothetical protein